MRGLSYSILIFLMFVTMVACDTDPQPTAEKQRYFIKLYGGLLQEEGLDMIQTSDGGYILIGSSNTPGVSQNSSKDIYVVKVNSIGDEEWVNTYGEPDAIDVGSAIIERPGGGFAFAGTTTWNTGSSAVVYEIGPNGETQNFFQFTPRTTNDSSTTAEDIMMFNNGDYLITGSQEVDDLVGLLNFTIIGGQIGNAVSYSFAPFTSGVRGAPVHAGGQNNDEGFVILGTSTSRIAGDQSTNDILQNMLAYRVGFNNGSLDLPNRAFSIGASGIEETAGDIVPTNSGYATLGTSGSGDNSDILFTEFQIPSRSSVNIKVLNSNSINLGLNDEGISLQQQISGKYIITGNTNAFSNGDKDIFLLELDPQGNVNQQWLAEPRIFGFSGDDIASKVIVTSDGGFAVVGTVTIDGSSPDDPNRNTMICLIKTGRNGKVSP